ncbi:MAG: glycosyltransferase [Clostridia bacterium]|nr:glycosyltransferase [Clostridia bacterium]
MFQPLISVIVPIYNAENFIKRCLDSICGQSYTNLEIVLVNDGSKDNTLSILKEYSSFDKRIKVIDQENGGVATARNTGLTNATGEYFLFVDADDWIETDMVERMVSLVEEADIAFCCADHAETKEMVKSEVSIETEIWDQDRQLLEFMKHKRMTGMLWNKLIKKSLADGIFFNPKTGYGEDAEFLWQILKKSKKMVVTNEILYHHVLENTSISHLSFSDKKYSAIPMWESIVEDAKNNYPTLFHLAKERLTSAAVFSLYEIKNCGYKNKEQIKHMRQITRKNIVIFLKSPSISIKFKLYAMAVCFGF